MRNWQAKWIWWDGEVLPFNAYRCARRTFTLPSDYGEVKLHISADSRYFVWINGHRVGFGPVRAFAEGWRYDTYDITSFVHSGENVIAVLIIHYGAPTFQYVPARAGLVAEIEHDGEVLIATDSSWLGVPHSAYIRRAPRIACQQGFAEIFDASIEPVGWTQIDFDDSGWKSAEEIGAVGCTPWGNLRPRDIPMLTDEPFYPAKVFRTRLVRSPKYAFAMWVKGNLAPDDKTYDCMPLNGLLATVLVCKNPAVVSIISDRLRNARLILDGQPIKWEDAHKGIVFSAGEHLLLFDLRNVVSHSWYPTVILDSNDDFILRSPLGTDDTWQFVTIGPFDSEDDPRFDEVASFTNPESVAKYPLVSRIPLEYTAVDDVYARTAYALALNGDPSITGIESVLGSAGLAVIKPSKHGDTEIIFDFGQELTGFVDIEIEAPKGAVVDFNGFEYVDAEGIQWTDHLNNTFRYISRGGRQLWSSIVRRGFRYASLTVRFPAGCTEPFTLYMVRCRLSTYPYKERGWFECNDDVINRAWDISRRTIRMCSEDTFVDCPTYEQAFWVGDSRNESLFSYTAFGDYALAKRCMLLAGESIHRSPMVESHVPSGWVNLLPAWSLLWNIGCEEYYLFSGDFSFLEEVYPAVRAQNVNIHDRFINKDGLFEIKAWNMLDWAPMDTPDEGIITHLNILLVRALNASASIADVLGRSDDAHMFRLWASDLREAINRHLWDESTQGYIDCIRADGSRSPIRSQQTQLVAYLFDIEPQERKPILEGYIRHVPDGWVTSGSPFPIAFIMDALDKSGSRHGMTDIIRRWWGLMLDHGVTTCWETFPTPGSRWPTRSHCHAWSAVPAYALPAYVLGVKPIEPGFVRFEVKPFLDDLEWALGTIPTPHGDIRVDLRRRDSSVVMSLTVPEGTSAVVNKVEYAPGTYSIVL
jgi:hypothetical protein